MKEKEAQKALLDEKENASSNETISKLKEELKNKENEIGQQRLASAKEKEELSKQLKTFQEKSAELEAKIVDLEKNQPKGGQTLYDSDDMGLLVVENEGLKRKIKMMEAKLNDQPSAEKVTQKIEAKDFEIRSMKLKLEKAEKEIVS